MDAVNATTALDEHAKCCIMQASDLREKVVLPKMLTYNPEAASLVSSIKSELVELEETFKQLHTLAVVRHTHLSTVEVTVAIFCFCINVHIFIYFSLPLLSFHYAISSVFLSVILSCCVHSPTE